MALDVHIHRRWHGSEQVIVQRGDLDSAFGNTLHHRIDLIARQDQIAHDHGAVCGFLERQPRSER